MGIVRHYVMTAGEGQADTLLAALRALSPAVEAIAGSEGVELLRDADNPQRFVFIERWASVEAHKAALGTLSKDLLGAVMAPLAGPPDGSYLAPA